MTYLNNGVHVEDTSLMNEHSLKDWIDFDLFNQVPINIAIIDRKFRIADANATFAETFGDWHGRKCYQAYKDRKRMCVKCKAAETFAEGKVSVSLERVRDRKGSLRYLRVRTYPFRDATGAITHIIEMSTDVTAREQALEQYQTILDNVPCYITVIDRDYNIVTSNKHFHETFGDEAGLHCFESYKKRKRICSECPVRKVFKDGRTHHSMQEGYDTKGKKVVYMVTASPYEKEAKRTKYAIEMAIDVTKTFSLQTKLRKAMEFQQVIVRNAIDGIIASDKDGCINIYNPAAKKILKHPVRKLVGKKKAEEIYPRSFLNAVEDGVDQVVLQESKIKNYQGEEIPIVLSGTTLKKDGEPIGTVLFFQDLSTVKQLQKEILEAERLTAVGQTVAGLSHGLKNIVMGLEGGMYVSTSGIKREDNALVQDGLTMLQDNIQKITTFVRGILNFAKGSVPKVELTDACSIAEDIMCLYEDGAKRNGVHLVSKFQEGLAWAPMDTQGIHTCIANLVSNAMDAVLMSKTKKPTVTLSVFQKNNTLYYEVKDNGCGMDYEVKKKIFTSFFTTKEPGVGTGVGLLTSRKIVHDHGGKITFDSTLGKGTVFRIELPRHRLPAPEEEDTVNP